MSDEPKETSSLLRGIGEALFGNSPWPILSFFEYMVVRYFIISFKVVLVCGEIFLLSFWVL